VPLRHALFPIPVLFLPMNDPAASSGVSLFVLNAPRGGALNPDEMKGNPHGSSLSQPDSFLEKRYESIGTRAGDIVGGRFLPGHFIPAPFFNEIGSLP
jgi:hypothetical protein